MKTFSKIILLFTFFFVSSCVNGIQQNKSSNYQRELYTSLGFALIYNNETFTNKIVNKKMKNDDLSIMHSSLRKNTLVRIINPVNSKSS